MNKLLQLLVGQLTHEKILICLIFPHFSAIFVAQITIFWNAHRPCQQYPNTVNKSLYHVYSFVPLFSSFLQYFTVPPLFLSDTGYSSRIQCSPVESSRIWSITQTDLGKYSEGLQLLFCRNWSCDKHPNNHAWTLTYRIIMILYFLTSWSYISFRFSGYNVLVTIFGNVHRPCRHYFIIVNNSLYHASSFSPHFQASFTSVDISGNVHRLYKQCINIIKNSLQHIYSLSPDFSWSSYDISITYHIRKCPQTM